MEDARKLYPLSENAPGQVQAATGYPLGEFTLEAVLAGRVAAADLTISPRVLRIQAEIARAAGRSRLAENFERAAELVIVPQEILLETYELLRPGRATAAGQLRERAAMMRDRFEAHRIAALIDEAAEVYERRALFTKRY